MTAITSPEKLLYLARRRDANRAVGLCQCGRKRKPGGRQCVKCVATAVARPRQLREQGRCVECERKSKTYRCAGCQAHRKAMRDAWKDARLAEGLCNGCFKRKPEDHAKKSCDRCRARDSAYRAARKAAR